MPDTEMQQLLARYRARRRRLFEAELEQASLMSTLSSRIIYLNAIANLREPDEHIKSLIEQVVLYHPEIPDADQPEGTAGGD